MGDTIMAPLEDEEIEAVAQQFIEQQFPGVEVRHWSYYTTGKGQNEYVYTFVENHAIRRIELFVRDWAKGVQIEAELVSITLHSGMELVPDDKSYHRLVKATSLLKEAMTEIE